METFLRSDIPIFGVKPILFCAAVAVIAANSYIPVLVPAASPDLINQEDGGSAQQAESPSPERNIMVHPCRWIVFQQKNLKAL